MNSQRHGRKANLTTSIYPSMKDIEEASTTQLGYWLRYLKNPGRAAEGFDNSEDIMAMESAALDYILQRFKQAGGWSASVSRSADRMHKRKTGEKDKPSSAESIDEPHTKEE